jgi:hypothetical protein
MVKGRVPRMHMYIRCVVFGCTYVFLVGFILVTFLSVFCSRHIEKLEFFNLLQLW